MATVKSDVEAVAACDWNDVDHLIQTLNFFSVYHFWKADNIAITTVTTITSSYVFYNIHSHQKTPDTVSSRRFFIIFSVPATIILAEFVHASVCLSAQELKYAIDQILM